jgi:hypothetical protein
MVRVAPIDAIISLGVRNRFGHSGGMGLMTMGDNRLGFYSKWTGIYKRHRCKEGWCISKSGLYRPTNRRTAPQQAWRAVFSAGWSAYRLLTENERAILLKEARRVGLTSQNLFMSRWLQSHRT